MQGGFGGTPTAKQSVVLINLDNFKMKTTSFQNELKFEIDKQGADFIKFVDISNLSQKQTRGYTSAILFGIILSQDYLRKVSGIPDYVEQMVKIKQIKDDEFHLTEIKTDRIADYIAKHISENGFKAFSQSEENLFKSGEYDNNRKLTPLPHKTIAGLAGLGWIGKHNLLITPDYGSAISMCSILTDAPLKTISHKPVNSNCGDCKICENICTIKAIKGKTWKPGISRNEIIDVFLCNTCFQCVVQCPWTQKYMNEKAHPHNKL